MHILISGVNGFIGTNMYNSFVRTYDITGLDITVDERKHNIRTYNWSELSTLPKVDAIIHLAGMAHDTKGTIEESKYFDINVGLTKQIFDYFLNSSSKKFIFFSSVKAVADTIKDGMLTENIEPHPETPYGRSKLMAEKYIMSKKLPKEKRVYILRPAMIHGPGNKGNLNLLYSIVQKGIPYPLGAFPNFRSFTSIGNVLYIIRQLLSRNCESGVYNICDDEPLSTKNIVELIYSSIGRTQRILKISQSAIRLLASVGDITNLPLTTERLTKMTESYVVTNKKIKKALSIKSLPVESQTGMIETIISFTKKKE